MDPIDEPSNSNICENVDNDDKSVEFRVDVSAIESVSKERQASELHSLELEVFDHATLEKGIIAQVNEAIKSVHDDNLPLASLGDREEGELDKSEDENDFARKLRLGEVTPFDKSEEAQTFQEKARNGFNEVLQRYMENQARLQKSCKKKAEAPDKQSKPFETPIKRKLSKPKEFQIAKEKDNKSRKKHKGAKGTSDKKKKKSKSDKLETKKQKRASKGDTEVQPNEENTANFDITSGSEYLPSDSDDSGEEQVPKTCKPLKSLMTKMMDDDSDSEWDSSDDEYSKKRKSNKELDDGDPHYFTKRVKGINRLEYTENLHIVLDEFKCPKIVWDKLYKYQQVAVKWFWELNQQRCGGILGDEMGLGKTIQVIAFLSGLYTSNINDYDSGYSGLGPSLIVCPTTVMHQWVREFHKWFPILRVAILHESGTYSTTGKERSRLIDSIHSHDYGVLITSYTGLVKHSKKMLEKQWHYVILDEGHKIRNHQAQVTVVAKQLETPHRLILSGSPLQNNLKELWSLFDFIFPGKLGTLQVFTNVFHMPIVAGGYTNASPAAVMQAFKCAVILKDTITPYLLRRMKCDVDAHIRLPPKTEQVLFCKLTQEQRELYKNYLCGVNIEDMIRGNAKIFVGLINLRKICNHPDLYSGDSRRNGDEGNLLDEDKFGYWGRAGKMIVVRTLLKIWNHQNHRVLLFTQTQKMLLILEDFVVQCGYKYLKLDGKTSVSARQPLIDKFNKDTSYFVMLLTTKVGGLGVNLTGANRVVIYDPDWNPATDTQARERAWRIGQEKDVTVYRLVTAGTIEEKIYHRQIFKQFLSNKVLKDPKQRRFFKSNDLSELFTLSETVNDGTTETAAIFAGTGSEVKITKTFPKKKCKPHYSAVESAKDPKITFSDSKIEQMKRLAHVLSQKIGNKGETMPKKVEEPVAGCSKTVREENNVSTHNEIRTETNVSDSVSYEIYGPDGQILSEKLTKSRATESTSKVSSDQIERLDSYESSKMVTDENDNHKPEVSLGQNDPGSPLRDDIPDKKSRRRKKKYQFEGHDVPHLLKCKKVKRRRESDERDIDPKSQDDYVLHKLFSKSGIETALRHDSIMDSGPYDYAIIEAEADKVAQEAIKALKASSAEVPVARKPLLKPTAAGSALLSAIKKRNLVADTSDSENHLVRSLVTWLCAQGGVASTDKIVGEFQSKVGPGKSPVFKSLLGKIATFSRGSDKIGYWTVKEEFKM